MKHLIATVAAAGLLASSVPATAASSSKAHSDTPFTFLVNATSADQGSFTGTFKIARFAVDHGVLVASGSLAGTLVDENAVSTVIYRTVTVPVILPPTTARATAAPVDCPILHLELGPLDLDLLGLVVHLDRVVLDITAVPGAGNLLGNLLCAIVGLLDGSDLGALSQLLNQLLDVLGGILG